MHFDRYALAVFIGRFSPYHLGHHSVVIEALKRADNLVILVGSCDRPRDTYNPFTFEERRRMILESVSPNDRCRVSVVPIVDYLYNDGQWVVGVQEAIAAAVTRIGLDGKIALIGHSKDHTSYYLKLFPQWDSIDVGAYVDERFVLSATNIRDRFFLQKETLKDLPWEKVVPGPVLKFLGDFAKTAQFATIREEFDFVESYKAPYRTLPYPPIFTTVDAVVVQSGHVLMVRRRSRPGKGLWALPGGFLDASERIEDAVYRELREETKIKVPEPVLRGSTVATRVFDAVHRSARGRTITHAFLIHLPPSTDLPKVKGSDDADKAKWVPIASLKRSDCFEDHHDIISNMVALI